MSLLDLFLGSLRKRVAENVRLGFVDGIKAVLGDQPQQGGEAESEETAVRLLLLPAPEPETKKRKGVAS